MRIQLIVMDSLLAPLSHKDVEQEHIAEKPQWLTQQVILHFLLLRMKMQDIQRLFVSNVKTHLGVQFKRITG